MKVISVIAAIAASLRGSCRRFLYLQVLHPTTATHSQQQRTTIQTGPQSTWLASSYLPVLIRMQRGPQNTHCGIMPSGDPMTTSIRFTRIHRWNRPKSSSDKWRSKSLARLHVCLHTAPCEASIAPMLRKNLFPLRSVRRDAT